MLYTSFRLLNTFTKNTFMETCTSNSLLSEAKKIFENAVKSVQPMNLIEKNIKVTDKSITIQGKTFPLNQNVYIVGFGKAVLGMALSLERKIKDHLVFGVISIPLGMKNTSCDLLKKEINTSCIHIYEGAHNNIPDEDSLLAATKISKLACSLTDKDLLIVLVSGGGSALLPSPKSTLTLQEKQKVITSLASKGATIEELNSVRKRLSTLKGGGLALKAAPAKVISLIISDIVGDPLSAIASGPTIYNSDDSTLPFSIIEKYNLSDRLPTSVLELLKSNSDSINSTFEKSFDNVYNFIIGNNQLALAAALSKAKDFHYASFIVTHKLKGIAKNVGKQIILLINAAILENDELFYLISTELEFDSNTTTDLLNLIKESKNNNSKICLLFGGETTVKVNGNGVGGRNQELALSASIELCANRSIYSLVLLSAGTDGIDGPTTAAGAFASQQVVEDARDQDLTPIDFLENNDSFNFYSQLSNGKWLLQTGHTGTNVMDIVVVLIRFDQKP